MELKTHDDGKADATGCFFFQAEDGMRDVAVTGVQTCALPIYHQYLYPRGLEGAMDIEAEEAAALGVRMTLTRGSMDLSEKDGGLPPDAIVQDEDAILAD